MPIFEFICNKCNKEFEALVLNSSDKIECPDCKSDEVTKQFSTFAQSSKSGCSNYDSCRPKSKHKCSGVCCNGS
ncbi:MAG: zinc ribbon domain-containing protein [Endomicrobia bacterium]|nr:zinc ribbon domain-containing protein [Endomicrobiia bacterium]